MVIRDSSEGRSDPPRPRWSHVTTRYVSVRRLIVGQASCGVPSPLEISTGTPWPSLLHDRRRVPSTDVTDRYPNACPACWCLNYLSMVDRLGVAARRAVTAISLLGKPPP